MQGVVWFPQWETSWPLSQGHLQWRIIFWGAGEEAALVAPSLLWKVALCMPSAHLDLALVAPGTPSHAQRLYSLPTAVHNKVLQGWSICLYRSRQTMQTWRPSHAGGSAVDLGLGAAPAGVKVPNRDTVNSIG